MECATILGMGTIPMFVTPMALDCLGWLVTVVFVVVVGAVIVVVLVLVVALPHVVYLPVLFPIVPYLALPLRSMVLAIASLVPLTLPWTSCGRHVLLWSNPPWVWV